MSEELVQRDLRDGVAVISMNRPARHNAISDAMKHAWGDALDWAATDPAVRAVLLRGTGKSFCSGRDTAELGERAPDVSHATYIA